ncbi:MAG: ribonuclease III [Lachnospiraceae bacterium]|nr:ribonuclease III [Lachnospiraceae bacterium]MDE7132793.1 ribonuclease III [Lachnospiraceae bacterium]MDE7258941.1 ribonuclease III [Lachnospiraceae bacterium]
MEESITILEAIKRDFGCGEIDIRTYSPLTLAYIGDAIYDLVIRTIVVERGNRSANNLHKKTVTYVNARVQARMIDALEEELTEEEAAVYHRGRNAKSYTSAKNASIIEYRKATGLEALCGYLYLQGQQERMLYLIREAIARLDMTI